MSSLTPLELTDQRSRHLLPLVVIALIASLGGCEYESDDVSLPSASIPTAEASFPTTDASGIPPLPESGDVDAGTYLVTSFTEPFEITVPDGWSGGELGIGKDDPDRPGKAAVYVGWWPSDHVPTDACAWQDALVEVNPSAEAFVEALTAQTSTASTPPVKVVVGDYSGFEFDHSVEGDVDITACDSGKFCIHSEMLYHCTRWYSSQDEHETYRVVDLNGQRAMFWVAQYHSPAQPELTREEWVAVHALINPELTREARAVFDSIVFKSTK